MTTKESRQQLEEYRVMAKMIKVIVQQVISEELKPIKRQLAEMKVLAAKQPPLVERAVAKNINTLKRQLDGAGYGNQKKPLRNLSTNPMLNSVLNDTTLDADDDESSDGSSMLMSQYRDELAESYGQPSRKSSASMIPTTDPDGHVLDLRNVPDGVIGALTKDYSQLLKASQEKSKQFRKGLQQ